MAALSAACARLGLAPPVHGMARLYEGEVTGQIVKLPGWTFPVIVDLQRGEVKEDNFGGAWGDPRELDKLLQAYAVAKATLEARKQGHSVTEQQLTDGAIKLTIQVAGGA